MLLPVAALAFPEGTPQLGVTQGLEGPTQVRVHIEQEGERIRLCSSDDGTQEPDAGGVPIDANPGEANPVHEGRLGREIILYAPAADGCNADEPCPMGLSCNIVRTGLPIDAEHPSGRCGRTLTVTANEGYCNSETPAAQWLEVITDVAGTWTVDFAAEPETITTSGDSTRYFEIDVRDPQGNPAPAGRVYARQWLLNAHTFDLGSAANFYVVADVGDGAHVFVIDYADIRGFRYGIIANRTGIQEHTNRSWCQFGDPNAALECPFFQEADLQRAPASYSLYLNFPNPVPMAPPAPALAHLRFEDDAGTPSISPNGDGVQDTGRFLFDSNLIGVYRITIDTDANGIFDATQDVQLSGQAEIGPNEVLWDGTDRDGIALPDGAYAFDVELTSGETHFPMSDIEDNTAGFVMWRQLGPDLGSRTPERMFWDDTAIRDESHLIEDAGDAIEVLPEGSQLPADGVHQRRSWRQRTRLNAEMREEDMPMIFDTWVIGEGTRAHTATCRRCADPFDRIRVGLPDEPGDRDGDSLDDDEEATLGTDPDNPDTDGDGLDDGLEVHADNPTDPTSADSDADGLADGIEDANQDGVWDADETDPNKPDTDGDTLLDGAEDRNGNGVWDADETDPRVADTDGDGIRDDQDPPGEDDLPDVGVDAGDGIDGGGGHEGSDIGSIGTGSDAGETMITGDDEGCACSSADHSGSTGFFWLLLATPLLRRRRWTQRS